MTHVRTLIAIVALLPFAAPGLIETAGATIPEAAAPTSVASCPVTQPNGNNPPEFGETIPPQPYDGYEGGYGNASLWTNLWMWGEGEVPVPVTHVQPDGAFGPMKWAWYRYVPGRLDIEGRRLDAPASPLQADIPTGYGGFGFQVSGITFPSAGCWEITGRLGDERLTFVTLVIAPESTPLPPAD